MAIGRDIYQETTDRIVMALEAGTIPWCKPWKDSTRGSMLEPHNALSGRPYNGVNWLLLNCATYQASGWLTFKQAQELGGTVMKGERGSPIVFWKFDQRKDETTGKVTTMPFARPYTVFNVEQCDGLDGSRVKLPTPPVPGSFNMNTIAANIGATVRHGGNKAFYTQAADYVQMPSADTFKDQSNYESTLAHELTHWTGHPARCNRQFGQRFGDQAYAFEELVAEIGSAFLCAQTGIALEGLQHPQYLASWLRKLKEDKRAIFTAASKAKEAARFIMADREEDRAAAD